MSKPSWKLTKKLLEDTLINPSKHSKHGLLLEKNEFGGVIEFDNNNCRIIEGEMVCDKLYSKHSIEKGNSDSVSTPLGRVNFHTHPLHCYISGQVIWGWPSGEDMGQCIRFAQMGNIYHVIFSLEGTYAIVVNKRLLNLSPKDISGIETIFKLTHKYRWYKNFEEKEDLYKQFKTFIEICGMNPIGKNTLELWIYFVNNFKIGHCGSYTDSITNVSPNSNIFRIYLFKNKSVQYELDHEQAYKKLTQIKTSKDLSDLVKMPRLIQLQL
jgi:hypothetical protein